MKTKEQHQAEQNLSHITRNLPTHKKTKPTDILTELNIPIITTDSTKNGPNLRL